MNYARVVESVLINTEAAGREALMAKWTIISLSLVKQRGIPEETNTCKKLTSQLPGQAD